MATSIWRPIRGDLRRILMSVSGVPAIAWEGRPYEPIEGVPFLRERIDKGNSLTATLSTYGMVEEQAIYALDLTWPRTTFADGEDVADAIRCAFWHGREIASSGPDCASGWVLSSSARPAIMFANWTQFPIRIGFFFRRRTAQGRPA